MIGKPCDELREKDEKYIRIGDKIYRRGCYDCLEYILKVVLSGDYEINTGKDKEGVKNGNRILSDPAIH